MVRTYRHGLRSRRRAGSAIVAALTVSLVLLAGGCATRLIRSTDLYQSYYAEPIRPGAASIDYEKQGRTHVFRLAGEEYAMGRLYGEQARALGVRVFYREVFDSFVEMLRNDVPEPYRRHISRRTVRRLLLDAWERMEPHTPEYIVRMLHGFADGAGLSREDVYAMHAIPDFTETSCSALWVTGSATAAGQTIQIRVLDYIMGLGIQANPAVVFYEFHTGHTVANIGWLGLLGVISGMNGAGLAVSEMGYGNPPGETLYGMPMPFLLLEVLRWTDDPAGAAGIIRSRPRTNSYVYIVGSASQGALAFVTDAYEVTVVEPGQTDAIVAQLPDSLHAGHYQSRMDELLAGEHGSVTLDWLMESFIPAIAMRSNLQSVVYDLSALRFFVADAPDRNNRAAEQPYREFGFR